MPLRGVSGPKMQVVKTFLILLLLTCNTACQQNTTAGNLMATPATESSAQPVQEKREPLKLPLADPHIVVLKSQRKLELYSAARLVRSYKIGLGLNPVPDKQREGDRATPEGEFYIFTKNPRSAFHLSLGVSYPNIEDAERGLKSGLITRAQRDNIVKAIKLKQDRRNTQRWAG